ncbi:MAG: hypothetical protein R2780_11325 [Crocinitomicaceae bacterium]|nr:hypothetical protein [Crocinitomicaceae bacterium]
MKKLALLLLFVAGLVMKANAQPPGYDDLVIFYADGDYERLLKTAEKYTLKDDTKNDALPYLYLAKCNFEMSKDQKWLEQYPKAYNDAIRFAGNVLKKDKDGTVYQENIQFFTDLKVAVVEDIKNLVEEEAFAKVMGSIAKLHRFAKDDLGSYFLKAGAQYMEKDKSGGKLSQKEAWDMLESVQSVEDWRPIDFEMLRVGVIVYCDAQINELRQPDAAKNLLGRVKQWLEKDPIFMAYYDKVVN